MPYYIRRKDIIKNLIEVKGEFTLNTPYGVLKGTGTDDMIGETIAGEQVIVNKHDYITLDLEAMAKGYMDMGDINLEESRAAFTAENAGEQTTYKMIGKDN